MFKKTIEYIKGSNLRITYECNNPIILFVFSTMLFVWLGAAFRLGWELFKWVQ